MYRGISTFLKCSSNSFTYELSRMNVIFSGLALALRGRQPAPTVAPTAPAAESLMKSRREDPERSSKLAMVTSPRPLEPTGPFVFEIGIIRPILGVTAAADGA